MRPQLAWFILTCAVVAALWQLVAPQPSLSPLAAGLMLLLVGILGGMRIATDSLSRFLKDLITINRHQSERNEDLADVNVMMLREIVSLAEDGSRGAMEDTEESSESDQLARTSQDKS